ncbi:MAG: alkaline phosphatase D family protein [Solirubrobacterales bacterium]
MPSRRGFLSGSLAAGAVVLARRSSAQGAPAIVASASGRPSATWGGAVGDVTGDRAIVWSRTDRPARLVVEYATTGSFTDARRVVGPAALEDSGFTARVDLSGLPPGQRITYRLRFQDLSDLRTWSEPVTGSFATPPRDHRDVTFAWGADTVGQGWGIDESRGGMRIYETMGRARPDIFIHCGDTVYSDQPLAPEVALGDGTVWRNLVTPAKSKVAETLEEFRGQHLYNLLDERLRRFNAEVSQVVLWDDHEVRNNWWPTQVLEDERYQVKSVALLAARAKKAFLEHQPIRLSGEDPERIYRSLPYGPSLEVFALDLRSDRGPNTANRQEMAGDDTPILGARQLAWLKERLRASPATWKVVACDMPIGLVVTDGPERFEAVAQGNGPPLGREMEIADLLRFLRDLQVRNVVWLTGDVHYAAAHHYDPVRARFKDFHPFWEFVAGPLHAGTFGPGPLDDTFGPEVRFLGIPAGMKPNRPPSEGLQFFGTGRIDAKTEVLTVSLHNLTGDALWSVALPPER